MRSDVASRVLGQCGSTHPNLFDIDELEASGGCSVARARPAFGFAAWCVAAFGIVARRRWFGLGLRKSRERRVRSPIVSRRFAVLAAMVLVLGVGAARASVSFAIAFDDLVRGASAVSLVTPVEQYAAWEGGRIYTFTRVRADRDIAGSPAEGAWIKTMGGVVGELGQAVEGEPALRLGVPALLFLEQELDAQKTPTGKLQVVGRAQGQFFVGVDATTSVRVLVARRSGALALRPGTLRGAVRLAYDVMQNRPARRRSARNQFRLAKAPPALKGPFTRPSDRRDECDSRTPFPNGMRSGERGS